MFLRKMIVITVPLALLLLACLLATWLEPLTFAGAVLVGLAAGVGLGLLLPLSGATRMREPFAHLLWIPAVLIALVILYQFLALSGVVIVFLQPLATSYLDVVILEALFSSFMLTFCIRTGRGI